MNIIITKWVRQADDNYTVVAFYLGKYPGCRFIFILLGRVSVKPHSIILIRNYIG